MTTNGPPSSGLIAVGHYLGVFPGEGGQWCHEVRRGADISQLTDEEARAWASPGDPAHHQSTLDTLVARALLVPVRADDATGFARSHRLLALLCGLGPSAEDPDRRGIGVFGRQIVAVDRLTYDLWAQASGSRSLWEACRGYAARNATMAGPHDTLVLLLGRLDELTSTGAACLDLALPEAPPNAQRG